MIRNIFEECEKSKKINRKDCLYVLEEVYKIEKYTSIVLRDQIVKHLDIEEWDITAIPTLCETIYVLTKFRKFLNKILCKDIDSESIRITSNEITYGNTYIKSLEECRKELKNVYYIMIVTTEHCC